MAATIDAIGDPSIGDSTIGDTPDDVIVVQVFECVDPGGLISYVRQPTNQSGVFCFPADLSRPPLP